MLFPEFLISPSGFYSWADYSLFFTNSILESSLDSNTVHFFFNEHRADFPLFTEALNFHGHKESMVRAAVRTLTLSVYRVREPSLERFLLGMFIFNVMRSMYESCRIGNTGYLNNMNRLKSRG